MKTGFSLTVFVCLLLVLAVAVGCVLAAFRVLSFESVLRFFEIWGGIDSETRQPTIAGAVRLALLGVALGVLSLTGLYHSFRRGVARGRISFPGSGGEVTIASQGLEDFVSRLAVGIPGVEQGRARVRQKGRELAVSVTAVLSGPRPLEISADIQNRIRSEIEQRLGLPKAKVDVHIQNMSSKPERPSESVSSEGE
jgi:uncharacterized alkaline shock family protein YloU